MCDGSTIGSVIAAASARLGHLTDTDPRQEAERLLGLATGLPRTQILAWPERTLTAHAIAAFAALVARRADDEPFAYLSGRQGFWTLELETDPTTLIPRPETEGLVDLALRRLPVDRPLLVADLGTGTGAIAAALASERPAWRLIATDTCRAALRVAGTNCTRLGLRNVTLVAADWLNPFGHATFDAVLTNPPYIAEQDPHLDRGGLRFEPRSALVSGHDGLMAIRRIVRDAFGRLHPSGLLAIEHGFDQGPAVRALLAAAGYRDVVTEHDLAGLERITSALRPPTKASNHYAP
ncbi:peptide chain release factor N(5)-glutamine methyltransferase [Thioalkalicoccus limnaeus]|uniref:Release factor glutamine methyltransferase n=1 Tax=Thioalkalicoccus limnaeus TaxID=120681 RepID=A0ABV4BEV3_9GAMM